MESASSGLFAGINAYLRAVGRETLVLPTDTMMGALAGYISDSSVVDFQPMGANFGILPELSDRPRDKKLRACAYASRATQSLQNFINTNNI